MNTSVPLYSVTALMPGVSIGNKNESESFVACSFYASVLVRCVCLWVVCGKRRCVCGEGGGSELLYSSGSVNDSTRPKRIRD